jgi:hypothetical protein
MQSLQTATYVLQNQFEVDKLHTNSQGKKQPGLNLENILQLTANLATQFFLQAAAGSLKTNI